jgi:hypothetical protein
MNRFSHTSRIAALTTALLVPAQAMAIALPAGAIPKNPAGAAARQAEVARRAALAQELTQFGFTFSQAGVAAAVGSRNYLVVETAAGGRLQGGVWHRWQGALMMPDPAQSGVATQVSMRLTKLFSKRFYGYQNEGNELTQFLTDVTGRVIGTQSMTWTGQAVTQFDVDGDGVAELVEIVNLEDFRLVLAAQEGAGVALADSLLNGDNPFCQQTRGGTTLSDRATGSDARARITACPATPNAVGSSVPATGGEGTRRHSVGEWYQDPLGHVCDGVDTVRAQFMAESGPEAFWPLAAAAIGLAEEAFDFAERQRSIYENPDDAQRVQEALDESPGICDDGSRTCGDMGLLGLCVARREAEARHPLNVLAQLMSESRCVNPAEAAAPPAENPSPGDLDDLVACMARENSRPNLQNLQQVISDASGGCGGNAEEGRECDDLPMSSHRTQSGRYWTSLQSIIGFDTCDPRICDPLQ